MDNKGKNYGQRMAMILASLAAMGAAYSIKGAPNRPQVKRVSKTYRYTGGHVLSGPGARQNARLERQKAKGMLDYSASERCIARINANV